LYEDIQGGRQHFETVFINTSTLMEIAYILLLGASVSD
jgi:hypothetical protein